MEDTAIAFAADATDNSPLYLQVARQLMQDVREGRYLVDQALPSERLLAEQMNISRVTARKAIDQLVEQGVVVRRRGSGNYVAARPEMPLTNLIGFSEQMRERGYAPSTRWIKRGVVAADSDAQLSLGLTQADKVARLERLRLADGQVLAYEICTLPQEILPQPEIVKDSLYEHLARTGHLPVRAVQQIRPVVATDFLAQQLGVAVGQPLLFVTRVCYLESGEAVELTHAYCRSMSVSQTPHSMSAY
jgi:GntR family transcriptional regulator